MRMLTLTGPGHREASGPVNEISPQAAQTSGCSVNARTRPGTRAPVGFQSCSAAGSSAIEQLPPCFEVAVEGAVHALGVARVLCPTMLGNSVSECCCLAVEFGPGGDAR